MKVTLDAYSGFCFGVELAVSVAERELGKSKPLYCLGPLVHNEMEVERLTRKGLVVVDHARFAALRDCRVLIRAHGEPPETYRIASENNIELIDATCPVVLSLQQQIGMAFRESSHNQGQIVIFGKKGHAEVAGLNGQTGNTAIILEHPEEAVNLDPSRPVHLFAQTTREPETYSRVQEILKKRSIAVEATDSICRQVSGQSDRLRSFALDHDVILFISGRESSNGRALFETCRQANERTYFISSPGEIDPSWFRNVESTGICGATSTPKWLMKEVADQLESIVSGDVS